MCFCFFYHSFHIDLSQPRHEASKTSPCAIDSTSFVPAAEPQLEAPRLDAALVSLSVVLHSPAHTPTELYAPDACTSAALRLADMKDRQLFWKPSWSSEEVNQVSEKYRRIRQSPLHPNELLTSQLYGIVVDDRNDLRGQLYEWIEIENHVTWDVVEKAPATTREKWVSQIRKTVSFLHSIDVVWGDVKADNVVIDGNGDAVVIDLEGGATNGWVDKALMNTKEGDLQGLERLQDYILNDDSLLRLRDKELDLSHFEGEESLAEIFE